VIEKLDELKALNEKFYELYGRLFKNRKLLDNAKTVEYFGKQLFEQYKAEYEALKYKYEIIELPELEKEKQRYDEIVPRTYRPWYFLFLIRRRNRALKNLEREVYCEIEKYFRGKEEALARLEAALDKTDNADCSPSALDEPKEGPETEPSEPDKPQAHGQAPGQVTFDDVQSQSEPKKP